MPANNPYDKATVANKLAELQVLLSESSPEDAIEFYTGVTEFLEALIAGTIDINTNVTFPTTQNVELTNNKVVEVQDQDNANPSNILTFTDTIQAIEIWHNEASPQIFIVNGINLKVASGGWRSHIGGTPSVEVTIPESITCIVTRLI